MEADCICSPFRASEKEIAPSASASSGVTRAGPQGAEPSNTLPGIHCGVANWRSPRREVVEQHVAGDAVERRRPRERRRSRPSTNATSASKSTLSLAAGNGPWRPAAPARWELGEEGGRLRGLDPRLGGVGPVVQPDANDLSGIRDRRQELHRLQRHGSPPGSRRHPPGGRRRAGRARWTLAAQRAQTSTTAPSRSRPARSPRSER